MTDKKKIFAIVPAGGIGKRMNNRKPKQFLTIFDQPILAVTLRALANTGLFSKFIIPSIDIVTTKKLIEQKLPDLDITIIKSGKTRQMSVHHGLNFIENLDEKPDLILVHDAVRVLVTKEILNKVVNKAIDTGAAIASNKVYDTLKLSQSEADEDTLIKKNISRENMWQAQTPQVFKSEIIFSAYDKAKNDHFEGTDSASLVERLGIPIHLVETTKFNFKITTPEDLEIAEIILSHRKDN
jgi:2-C-methyl-D-erythritol 4-phosphate cytidylyltransferase